MGCDPTLRRRRHLRRGARHVLLLRWLLLSVLTGFGLIAAWHYGLVQRILTEDPTRITLGIAVLFALALLDGARHVLRLSRALNHTAEVEAWAERHGPQALRRGLSLGDPELSLPEGCVTAHLRRLGKKAGRSDGHAAAAGGEQALLLQAFETRLRRGQELAWFVADLLLTLGLIGTVVGFIAMLSPLAGLDPTDAASMKRAIGAMSGGMAVALYTTLAGLVGGALLRVQGLLLDGAAEEVVRRTTELAELHVVPLVRSPAATDDGTAVTRAGQLEAADAAA